MTTRSKLSCRTSPCQARPDTVWRAQAGVDYVQRFPEPGRNMLAGKDLLSVKEALRKLKPTLPAEVGSLKATWFIHQLSVFVSVANCLLTNIVSSSCMCERLVAVAGTITWHSILACHPCSGAAGSSPFLLPGPCTKVATVHLYLATPDLPPSSPQIWPLPA